MEQATLPKKARKIFFRLFLVSFILLSGTELALQAGHFYLKIRSEKPALPHGGAPAILCVGDSHTFGVKLPPEQSYPGQLQTLLNREGYEYNAINAGVPGMNTSELRHSLPGLLDEYEPAAVIIMIGTNNKWNKSYTAKSDLEDGAIGKGLSGIPKRAWHAMMGRLRTVRLISYLKNEMRRRRDPVRHEHTSFKDRDGMVHFHEWRPADEVEDMEVVIKRTRRDLSAIVKIVTESGAEPVFLTYGGKPKSTMELENHMLRTTAASQAAALADSGMAIEALTKNPDGTWNEQEVKRLFLPGERETHLNEKGYAVMSKVLFETLVEEELIKIK